MFRLYTAANLPEAYLLLHRLVQAGIDARVLNEPVEKPLSKLDPPHFRSTSNRGFWFFYI